MTPEQRKKIDADFDAAYEQYRKEHAADIEQTMDEDDDIQVYKKPWVDLTKEEKDACVLSSMYHTAWSSDIDVGTLVEVVSAKLKEKNL